MLPKSRFLEFFVKNKAAIIEQAHLIGDIMLVEKIKFPEKKIGSIIIAETHKNALNSITADIPCFYRVLLPGEGYYDDETKESVPLDIEQGDIILTGSVSVKLFSSFPLLEMAETDILGVTRHGDIQWRFKGEEAFSRFLADLNQAVKAQVPAQS